MRETKKNGKKSYFGIAGILVSILILFPTAGMADAPKPEWVVGPAVVDLGKNLAQLSINEKYIFADSEDTKKIIQSPIFRHNILRAILLFARVHQACNP